ncbi:hypothetical protein Xen7305DRAFT_00013000 [Xenococcus sp. PCC 7305]|uniref:DUF6515 family protein n=1 Tax=Xenococcus sp. PCC 7305 TaxID=102125 RepID=UPI0002AC2F81|nr:DUF6515 family protein [Xenococcus sp. PCC 7305]ELS01596.1 hypothetical protein Xen7305DRAFT_00013000 [Xenococcus sp. PCC 7305]
MKRIITTFSVLTILSSQQLAWPIFLSLSVPAMFTGEAVAQRRGGGGSRGGRSGGRVSGGRSSGGQSRPQSSNRVNRQPSNRNTMNRDRKNSGQINRSGDRNINRGNNNNINRGGDRTINRGGDRTNAVNRGDININRNNINVDGRNYRRPSNVNIDVRRNVYVGRPGWRTYGSYWGPYGVHAGFAWLSFLTAALLIGSYNSAQNNQTVYVYIVEEEGVEKEYHVDEDGEILSVEIVS